MLSLQDLGVLRQALDSITLTGKDAKYIADLQTRLEKEILKITQADSQTNTQTSAKK